MFTSEMYKIEKMIHSYKKSGIIDVQELADLQYRQKLSREGYFYYYLAIIIPYLEMLEHIKYYYDSHMEETTEMRWWDKLVDKYNKIDGHPIYLPYDSIFIRFEDVRRLSNSLIYRKRMEELYSSTENKEPKNDNTIIKKLKIKIAEKDR